MSQRIIILLTIQYGILILTSIFIDKNIGKALYWIGAVLLNTGVLLMK